MERRVYQYVNKLSVFGRSGKLLLKVRRPYEGEWALAESAGALSGEAPSGDVGGGDSSVEGMIDAGMAEAGIDTTADAAVSTPGATPAVEGGEETQSPTQLDLSFIDKELEELEGKPADPQDDLLTPPEGIQEGTPASERFQKLANTNRELSQQVAQHQTQVQQLTNYVQQLQGWAQQQQQACANQFQQMQRQMQQPQMPPQQQIDPNDPVAKLRNDFLEAARAEWQEKFDAQQREFNEYRQAQEQAAKQAWIDNKTSEYKAKATAAARDIALKGMPEQVVAALQETIGAQIMTTALYQQTSVAEAARLQRANTLRMAREIIKLGSAGLKQSLERSKKAPPITTGQPGVGGKGFKEPTKQELLADGYVGKTALSDWAIDHGVVLPG